MQQDDQPNHQNYKEWVDLIGNEVETAYQRFRWLVISWRRPVYLEAGALSGADAACL